MPKAKPAASPMPLQVSATLLADRYPLSRHAPFEFMIMVADTRGRPVDGLQETDFLFAVDAVNAPVSMNVRYSQLTPEIDENGQPVVDGNGDPVMKRVPGPARLASLPGYYRMTLERPPTQPLPIGRIGVGVVVSTAKAQGRTLFETDIA